MVNQQLKLFKKQKIALSFVCFILIKEKSIQLNFPANEKENLHAFWNQLQTKYMKHAIHIYLANCQQCAANR